MITAPHLHPIVIYFPIALLMAGFLSELIALFNKKQFFRDSSFFLLLLGAIGTIVACLSGSYVGGVMTDGILQESIELYEEAVLVMFWLAIITALLRSSMYYFNYQKKWIQWGSFALFILTVGFVARTGYLDRQLVFKQGAGMELEFPSFEELSNE